MESRYEIIEKKDLPPDTYDCIVQAIDEDRHLRVTFGRDGIYDIEDVIKSISCEYSKYLSWKEGLYQNVNPVQFPDSEMKVVEKKCILIRAK